MSIGEIEKRARADLTQAHLQGERDVFLWECAVRVEKNARYIAALSELRSRQPDPVVLTIASLYGFSGWAVQVQKGRLQRQEILLRAAPDSLLEESASCARQSLSGLVEAAILDRAVEAILAAGNRTADLIEAQIVSDAQNLEEFGVLFVWVNVRRGLLDGKGVQAVLDTWNRRREYGFWSAKIRDAFHFEGCRKLAKLRLQRLEEVMNHIAAQQECRDIL